MEIINDTPFQMAYMPGRMNYPGHSLTLIVKGTFDLVHQGFVTPAAEQAFPDGDQFYDDDEDQVGAPRFETDFCVFKPRADLVLVGCCHMPADKDNACEVEFTVGGRSKSLAVVGDQLAKRGAKSKAQSFKVMELRYEKAFGGKEFPKNPAGLGDPESIKAADLKEWPLPNIRDKKNPERPAGFGPLNRMWKDRMDLSGTYDEKWAENRWPWFPTDFDWSFFNCAPIDQQVKGYLKGDEPLRFLNLHPQHAEFESQLPGLRVRGFYLRGQKNGGKPDFLEVPLNLDTLWVDMTAGQLSLVWRGYETVSNEEFPDLEAIFLCTENIADEPATVEACQKRFVACCVENDIQFDLEPEPEADTDKSVDEALAAASPEHEERAAQLAAVGIAAEAVASPEEKKAQRRAAVVDRIAGKQALDGEDLSELDLAGLDLSGLSLKGAILAGAGLSGSNLSGADLSEANLAQADLTESKLTSAKLLEADMTGANLSGADLSGAELEGCVLEKANCSQAVFDGAKAKQANFAGAQLVAASLKGSELASAFFAGCALGEADFSTSDLTSATLEGCKGEAVNLAGARLTNLRASSCELLASNFAEADAFDSGWIGAKLDQADFSAATLTDADFEAAHLPGANFRGADCCEASFSKSILQGADFTTANLMEGEFGKADLTQVNFAGSNLYGANFMDSKRTGMTTLGANIDNTELAPKPKKKKK